MSENTGNSVNGVNGGVPADEIKDVHEVMRDISAECFDAANDAEYLSELLLSACEPEDAKEMLFHLRGIQNQALTILGNVKDQIRRSVLCSRSLFWSDWPMKKPAAEETTQQMPTWIRKRIDELLNHHKTR